jgi:O-antigen/teichoic acid export membrane protein
MENLRNRTYRALRRSESLFKTDMVYLAKGGFWLNGTQVATALASFGLAMLFARLVPKEIYGNYRYILSLAGIAATFSLSGVSSAIIQSVARGFPGTFVEAVRVVAKWNTLIFAFSVAASLYYFANDNTTLGSGLIIIALLFPAIRTFEIYEAYLGGKKDFRRSALYRATVDIATIAATATALLFTDNVLFLIAANLLAQFIFDFIFFRRVYREIRSDERSLIEPGIIEFTKHLSLQNVLTSFAAYLDKIIIFHFLGAAQVAVYTFATALPMQIKGQISSIVLMITPKISQRSAKEAADMIPARFLVSLYILIPVVAAYIFFAPLIFKILFPAYLDAIPYTRWYALVLLLMGNLSGLVLTTQKAARDQYILTTFGSLSQIILMLFLVHSYGIVGIVWAYLISKYLSALLSYVLVRRFANRAIQ